VTMGQYAAVASWDHGELVTNLVDLSCSSKHPSSLAERLHFLQFDDTS
jgi:hypothetical protein